MALNIADFVEHAIDLVPDRVALVSDDREMTYAQMEDRANRLGHYLREQGVQPGDKVGIYCRNTIEAIEAMVAVFKIRAVMVNINYRYVENELQYIFDNSDMVALIHERRYSDKVANVLPNTPWSSPSSWSRTAPICDFSAFGIELRGRTRAGVRPSVISKSAATTTSVMLYTGGTTGKSQGRHVAPRGLAGVFSAAASTSSPGVPVEDEYEMAKVGAEPTRA